MTTFVDRSAAIALSYLHLRATRGLSITIARAWQAGSAISACTIWPFPAAYRCGRSTRVQNTQRRRNMPEGHARESSALALARMERGMPRRGALARVVASGASGAKFR
jgi:hypothetical protein